MVLKYLVDISTTFVMEKMMLLLPEKVIQYRDNKFMAVLKQVCELAIETILEFVMGKIAAIIPTQFVKLMKNITYFFKKKNLREPICTHVV